VTVAATILLGLVSIVILAGVVWYVGSQTVEDEHVHESDVHAEPLWDWDVMVTEWRPSSIITPEEWDAMCWALKQSSGLA
jgi:hypothetical protein